MPAAYRTIFPEFCDAPNLGDSGVKKPPPPRPRRSAELPTGTLKPVDDRHNGASDLSGVRGRKGRPVRQNTSNPAPSDALLLYSPPLSPPLQAVLSPERRFLV